MKFDPQKCPECGGEAESILDLIPAAAGISYDEETDSYDEDGNGSRIDWDGQRPMVVMSTADPKQPLVQLCCGDHTWLALRIQDPEDDPRRKRKPVKTFEAIVVQDLDSTTVNIPEK